MPDREAYSLDYSVVRLFNIYGEEQRDDFVISKFVRAVCQNKPPVIYGDGQQVRSFCYVSDAAKGIVNSLFCKEANGRVFNIGNDSEPISVKKLAEKTINLIGKNGISPQYVAMENSDRTKKREVYNRIPTIEKARKVLQYSPKVSLDEGITNVINYWNRNELKV